VLTEHISKGGVKGTSPVSVFGSGADSTDESRARGRGRGLVVALGCWGHAGQQQGKAVTSAGRASQAGCMAGMGGPPTYPTYLSI